MFLAVRNCPPLLLLIGEQPRHRLCEPLSLVPSYFLGCGRGSCCLAVTRVVGGGWQECDFNRQKETYRGGRLDGGRSVLASC